VTRPQPPLGAVEVLLVVGLSLAALTTIGNAAVVRHGAAGVLLAELAFVLAPTATWLWARAVPLPSLGLGELAPTERLRVLPVVGALLAGAGMFYVMGALVEPAIERVYPTPPALREAMEHLVSGGRPLYADLFALALAPAIAEELLFRGALWDVAERRAGTIAAVIVAAVAFAIYHGSPHRFAPVLVAGVVLGIVRARSRSLVPAIACHFANNAGVLVALRLGYRDPPASWPPLATALTALVAGLALLSRRR
jgi:membrane protease YdiL (CAAX protease family)